MDNRNTPLLIIDMQTGFDDPVWGKRNNKDAENNVAALLNFWRTKAAPVIHVQHCSIEAASPLRENSPGNAFKTEALPVSGEKIFKKSVNSAFIGTGLEEYLKGHKYGSLVVCGLTTDHCVSTTVRMAGNLGFDVILAADATATFAKTGPDGKEYSAAEIHNIHLISLNNEFCQVLETKKIIK